MAGQAHTPHMTPARWRDRQYGAAFTLFEQIGRGHSYVCSYGIRKEDLLRDAGEWSHGEQIMVRSALELFDPGCVEALGYSFPSIGEVVAVLDDEHLGALLKAITIARGWRRADAPAAR